jgi:FMN phosphatase YigB (HAD superfamily)
MQKGKVVLFDIDYTLFDTGEFKDSMLRNFNIYEGTIGILVKLGDIANLGIFSNGEPGFQRAKLEKTDMLKFFKENDIHIFDDKDANLINVLEKYKDTKLFLVDDKLTILSSAKQRMPQITAIWVKRGPYAQNQQPIDNFVPDATIDDLSRLYNIVSSND